MSQTPTPSPELGPQAQYQAYLDQGRFMLQVSRATGRAVFYPRVAEPGSGATDLQWVPASGLGTLYAITVNRSRSGAYNIALVDLDEGPRMMSHIAGVESVAIGTRLQAEIATLGGVQAVVFRPLPAERP